MKYCVIKYYIVIIVALSTTSCFNEDINKISEEYIWKPDISIPVFDDIYYLTDTRLSGSLSFLYSNQGVEYIPIAKDFTLSFNDAFEDVEYIQKLYLNLGIENFTPSEIQVYLDFMKYPSIYIKSLELEEDIIIPPAISNSNGDIIKNQIYTQLIPIDTEDEPLMQETEFVRLEIRLINREISEQIIANLNNYYCNCSIGIKAILKVPVN